MNLPGQKCELFNATKDQSNFHLTHWKHGNDLGMFMQISMFAGHS